MCVFLCVFFFFFFFFYVCGFARFGFFFWNVWEYSYLCRAPWRLMMIFFSLAPSPALLVFLHPSPLFFRIHRLSTRADTPPAGSVEEAEDEEEGERQGEDQGKEGKEGKVKGGEEGAADAGPVPQPIDTHHWFLLLRIRLYAVLFAPPLPASVSFLCSPVPCRPPVDP